MKILLLFLTLLSCNNTGKNINVSTQKIQENPAAKSRPLVEISYFKDKDFPADYFDGVNALLTTGFDSIQQFKVYTNKKEITSFSCKTNYSVGLCLDKTGNTTSFFLDHKLLISTDTLYIETTEEYLAIPLADSIKEYNRVEIQKEKEKWHLHFENSSRILIWE